MRRALLCMAVLLGAACGGMQGPGPGGAGIPPPSPPVGALAAWKDFPAAADPRPIIWLYSPGIETSGFPSGDGKLAAICNKLALDAGLRLPATGPATAGARWPSGTSVTYHVSISAVQAFGAITRTPVAQDQATCAPLQPLVITGVRLGTHGFQTDRGTAQVTAWLFDLPSVGGVYAYPALDPSAFWGGGMISPGEGPGIGGNLSPDGRTLTIGLVSGPDTPGPCGVDLAASVAESASAVAVAVASKAHGGPDTICNLVGYPRKVTVHLQAPLGGRVLVDSGGRVGTACPIEHSC